MGSDNCSVWKIFSAVMYGCNMQPWIDGTLYPDREPPEEIATFAEKMEFLHLMCAAWDWGIFPEAETRAEIQRTEWREIVDALGFDNSISWHVLRDWHGLPQVPYTGQYTIEKAAQIRTWYAEYWRSGEWTGPDTPFLHH